MLASRLLMLAMALSAARAALNAIGFSPSLSAACATQLSALGVALEPLGCGPRMADALVNSSAFAACSSGVGGVDCFSVDAVVAASMKSKYIIPAYRFPTQQPCGLCTASSGMSAGCLQLLQTFGDLVYGGAVNYTAYGISDPATIAQLQQQAAAAAFSCRNETDQASVRILEYQAQVVCGSTDTLDMEVSPYNTLEGVLDMRSLTQCGTCAVLPCFSGQLCDGTGPAALCPEGYYCPTPAQKLRCPADSYCPVGSTEPKQCRGVAGSSCPAGSAREVAWVPLFFVLLFLCGASAFVYLPRGKDPAAKVAAGKGSYARVDALPENQLLCGPVSINFSNLRLVSGDTLRLNDVSGDIRSGTFTAILGGSGAGKTSLMNVILGREAKTAGSVTYVNEEYPQGIPGALLNRAVAFVPQNDVFLREMTVYELVRHSAMWRSPRQWTAAQIEQRVEDVLRQLQLAHLRDVAVGSVGSASALSPGDRKKVNIALELVAAPNVLFLDEPTTGIDATAALNVARIVSSLAKAGLTCVAVIHQPRAEIFDLLDDLIILIRGGRVAYQGPAPWVLEYFASHGFVLCDEKANKTDFLIDITSKPPPRDQPGDEQDKGSVQEWADLWATNGARFLLEMQSRKKSNEEESKSAKETNSSRRRDFLPLSTPRKGFFTQLLLNARRGVQQHLKGAQFLTDLFVYFVGGAIMGIVSSGGPLYVATPPIIYQGSCPPGAEVRCNVWIRFQIAAAVFLLSMIIGAITIPGAVRTFGREKQVFLREAYVGADKLAYFLGKYLSDMPFLVMNVFVFMAPMIAIAPWQGPTDRMFGAMLCLVLCVNAMGYWLSVLFADPDAAVLTGVILAILLNLFSGFVPKIGDGVVGLVMYTRWAARALCANELIYGQGVDSVSDYNDVVPENWRDPDLSQDLALVLLITALLSLLTFLNILYINRPAAKL